MRCSTGSVNRIKESVRLLELIAEASDTKTEIELLEVTNAFFSDHSPSDRNFLCDSGAITVVLKCLHRCRQSSDDCVTVLTCNLLGNLLFNSTERATHFLQNRGAELVSLLFRLFTQQQTMASQSALIELFYQLEEIKLSLLSTANGHVLIALLQKHMYMHDDRGEIASMLLSAWTHNKESRIFVAKVPNAVENIVDCALVTQKCLARFYLARVVRNLAAESLNQNKLIKTKGFFRSLELFLSVGHGPTKYEAIRTVEILASNNQCKTLICNHNRASIVKLMAANMNSLDYTFESARAIFRLIERKTAGTLIKRCPNLVPSLMCLSLKTSIEHGAAAVAAYSLMRFAKYISVDHKAHPIMMKVLLYLCASSNTTIRIWAALALLEHSKSKTSAIFLVRSPLAVKALATLANDTETSTRNLAMKTMLRIASDIPSMKLLVFNSELIEAVINQAVVEIRQSKLASETIELVLTFTSLDSAHARLAKQFGLVESLAFIGVQPGAGEKLRRRALHAVSVLAEHL